ncbi:MAG TPA: metallophosphoesterase [Sphingomonadaceae bacterium]|nr:metallophosphoesterase [Sphingomonadaceae bacterium]
MKLLNRLRRGRPQTQPASAALPDGLRVYAIGDVHGRLDLLDALLARIVADDAARGAAATQIIFLGDLVDRGPDSAGVIDRARALAASGARFLMGNHEELFLRSLDGDVQALRTMLRVGGRETILSYGVSEEDYAACDYDELSTLIRERVPREHVAFLSAFEDAIVLGDYAFVHAGIRPGMPMAEQSASDLRWIRREFLESEEDHGLMIVHGHSISETVDERPNRIGIDTGAFASGRLTAVALEGRERWYLES